jgi:flagellar basal-body rod modification protein FlgD
MTTIASTSTTVSATGTGSAAPTGPGAMGKDDFLKLLVGQLQHQDPANPTGDSDFIGQMAQFSMLEQLGNLATATHELSDRTGALQSVGLIGRTATYLDADGNPVTGTVDAVDLAGGTPTLTIAGIAGIDPTRVSQVR